MSHIRVLICRVDAPASYHMTQLAAFDLPAPDPTALQPATALDKLEMMTRETGNAILRCVLQAQWETLDTTLAQQYRQRFSPEPLTADSHEPLTVASRFTQRVPALELMHQVLVHHDSHQHVLPGNTVLPPHNGMIITRGLQEWACLLPQELPFASAARLLGWQTREMDVLSDTTIRSLVRSHGQNIRQAEHADIVALAAQHDLTRCGLQLVPHHQPRRRPGWPAELNAAVDAALAADQVCPPEGISWANWERGKRCPPGRDEPVGRRVAAFGAGVRA
jgi:hypothetical protein